MPTRVPKKAPAVVRDWERFFRNNCSSKYLTLVKADDDVVTKIAAHIAIVGSVKEQEAKDFFWAICTLFCQKKRKSRWTQAVDVLPATRSKLLRITQSCKSYVQEGRTLQKNKEGFLPGLDIANMNLTSVLKVMVDCEDPESLVEFAVMKGKKHPSHIFDINTLLWARKIYRGSFQDNREEFMEEIEKSNVKQVEI